MDHNMANLAADMMQQLFLRAGVVSGRSGWNFERTEYTIFLGDYKFVARDEETAFTNMFAWAAGTKNGHDLVDLHQKASEQELIDRQRVDELIDEITKDGLPENVKQIAVIALDRQDKINKEVKSFLKEGRDIKSPFGLSQDIAARLGLESISPRELIVALQELRRNLS